MKDVVHVEDSYLVITKKIPAYKGYEKKERVSSSDRQIRMYLLNQITGIKSSFKEFKARYENQQGFPVEIAKNISMSFKALTDSLQNPCYCNNGRVPLTTFSENENFRLIELDAQLIEQVQIMKEEISNLQGDVPIDELKDQFNFIYDLVDGFNQLLSEREFIFLGQQE